MKNERSDYTVTSFIFSKKYNQLSNKRALFFLKERMGKFESGLNEIYKNMLPPISVALCPTSKCIRQCEFCSNTERNKQNSAKDIMYSRELFEQIIDDLSRLKVKGVSVAGGGEPLTYGREILNSIFSDKVPFRFGIHTNGVYLDKIMTKEILNTDNIQYINISVVAHNEKLYEKVTKGNVEQFKALIDNIKNVIDMENKYEKFPTFGVKILISRSNYKYIKDIYDFYKKELNVSNVLLRCVGNFEPNQDVELLDFQKKELMTILLEELGLPFSQVKTIISGGEALEEKIPIPSKCWINELQYCGGIDPDGEVYLCSLWSHYPYSIGNVNEKRFIDIWGSIEHRKAIELLESNLSSGKCNPLSCRHYYTNLAIDEYVRSNYPNLSFDFDEDYCRFI